MQKCNQPKCFIDCICVHADHVLYRDHAANVKMWNMSRSPYHRCRVVLMYGHAAPAQAMIAARAAAAAFIHIICTNDDQLIKRGCGGRCVLVIISSLRDLSYSIRCLSVCLSACITFNRLKLLNRLRPRMLPLLQNHCRTDGLG